MYRLVPALVHEMGDTYHELQRAQPLITETLHLEETRFKKTLEKGLGLLGEASGKLKKGDVLPGETAFKLYDTYGFPLDLTEDALRARGVTVDTKAFDAAMERQKAEARKAWKGSGEAATESIWFEVKEKTGATEFLGYDTESASGRDRRARQGRQGSQDAEGRRRGGDRRQPDAVLRRVRRPGRRHGRHPRRQGRAVPRHRHAEEGGWPVRPPRQGRERRLQARRSRRSRRRSRCPLRHPRQPLGDPPAARGAAPGARRSRRAARLARRGRPPALRLRAHQADDRRGDRQGRGHRQRDHRAERTGRDAADGRRGRQAVGRARAVRREVRR